MRIIVVIPNEEWRNTAGVRIRYEQIRPFLEAAGHSFELQVIDNALLAKTPADALYILSKCHDIRAVLLTRQLQAAGCSVGIDVFDDYYSQETDAAFVHLREWFRAMVSLADFAMCSTPNMHARLRTLAPDLPLLIMNDPAGEWEEDALDLGLERVLDRTLNTRQIDIAWFGIGDNPYFPLGLEDLSAFSGMLLKCRAAGFVPRLRILTNRRALDARRLEMIARLPMPCTLDEWSEEAEQALIADSLFCFLPVNGQEFSTVKSLNRAVSVLTRGSQVLSAGFALYETLAPFIYRDITELLQDLPQRRLRLRGETLPQLVELMSRLGSAEVEAGRLLEFLARVRRSAPVSWPGERPVVVVHGNRTLGAIHKQVQKNGFLSVAAPRSTVKLHFDIKPAFSDCGTYVDLTMRARAIRQLRKPFKSRAKNISDDEASPVYVLRLTKEDVPELYAIEPMPSPSRLLEEFVCYRDDMRLMRSILQIVLTDPWIFLSELGAPYWAPEMRPEVKEAANAS